MKTFVVLDGPLCPVGGGVLPLLKLRQGVEGQAGAALGDLHDMLSVSHFIRSGQYLDNRCDELLQEGKFQQRRPVVMDKVDQKTLDMGAVLVLICHDHHFAIPKT